MARILITDMNETYPADMGEILVKGSGNDRCVRTSMKDIPGRNMYVSDDALDEIRSRLSVYDHPEEGIHLIDTGNYHYMSYVYASFIRGRYDLVLLDHHTDMQETAFGDLLSCGSWAGKLLAEDEDLRTLTVIGPDAFEDGGELFETVAGGRTFSGRVYKRTSPAYDPGEDAPLYISVDKDMLDTAECVTNWDQGSILAEELGALIRSIAKGRKVIGADICGGISVSDPGYDDRALSLNLRTDLYLINVLREVMGQ